MTQPSSQLLRSLAASRAISPDGRPLPQSRTFVARDGIRLHYLDWSGEGETLILLHGGMLSAHTFDLLVLALGPDLRCLALDMRGHGLSGWADDYSIEAWAQDVCELIAHLELPRVHLVGMSLGGCVAGHAAAELGPKLASLVFVDVAAKVCFEASERMRNFLSAVRPVESVEALVEQALLLSSRTDPELMLYRYQSLLTEGPGGYFWKADRRSPTDFEHILARLAELPALAPQLCCPVLVVKGGRSNVLTATTAAEFAQCFPDGRWALISDAGHNIQEDHPVALAALVSELVEEAIA